jgi:hypothetical protein
MENCLPIVKHEDKKIKSAVVFPMLRPNEMGIITSDLQKQSLRRRVQKSLGNF